MASRFRNELTVVPSVRIKIDRQGLATTINWDAEIVNQRLPASRTTLGIIGDRHLSGPLPTDRYLIPGTRTDFGRGDVAIMTSPGLDDFKKLLAATRERECEIRSDIFKAKSQLVLSWAGRALAWTTLASVASKSIRTKTSTAVALRRSEVRLWPTTWPPRACR